MWRKRGFRQPLPPRDQPDRRPCTGASSAAVSASDRVRTRDGAGTVHGGLAATLLDSAMGLAVQSMLDKGFAQTTLEFKISLVRPITPQTGLVKAEGKVISCGRRVGTAEGKLTDKDGRVLAHGTTTCLIYEH